MQFKEGAKVLTADGKKVGHVDRVVLYPHDDMVTHLVVHKGFFFPEDKVIPIDFVQDTNEDTVTLSYHAHELDLPPFEVAHYIPLGDSEEIVNYTGYNSPMYAYPPITNLGEVALPHAGVVTTKRNLPEDAIALKVGRKYSAKTGCRWVILGVLSSQMTSV